MKQCRRKFALAFLRICFYVSLIRVAHKVMASSWESLIAASTSGAPAHTSVAATPSATATPGVVPATLPAAAPPQQSYSPSDSPHQTPQPSVPHYQYHQQPHPSQPPYQGIRVTIPPQVSAFYCHLIHYSCHVPFDTL